MCAVGDKFVNRTWYDYDSQFCYTNDSITAILCRYYSIMVYEAVFVCCLYIMFAAFVYSYALLLTIANKILCIIHPSMQCLLLDILLVV